MQIIRLEFGSQGTTANALKKLEATSGHFFCPFKILENPVRVNPIQALKKKKLSVRLSVMPEVSA